jgi:hypothetical protein
VITLDGRGWPKYLQASNLATIAISFNLYINLYNQKWQSKIKKESHLEQLLETTLPKSFRKGWFSAQMANRTFNFRIGNHSTKLISNTDVEAAPLLLHGLSSPSKKLDLNSQLRQIQYQLLWHHLRTALQMSSNSGGQPGRFSIAWQVLTQ